MTPPEIENYLRLVPPMNRDKPKFVALLSALLQPLIDIITFLSHVNTVDFDIDTAIGAQLDILGVIIGRSRNVPVPIPGVFFSFDLPGQGFDQASWFSPFDQAFGLVQLDDSTYRTLLQFKIHTNKWDGTWGGLLDSLPLLQQIVSQNLFVEDRQDMSITVGISGTPPSKLLASVLQLNWLMFKPEGVKINGYKVSSTNAGSLFGFDMHNEYVGGFDNSSWAADLGA